MALRFDATGDSMTRTTGLPSITGFTIMAWVYISVDRNAFTTFFGYGSTSGGSYDIQTSADGVSLSLFNGSSDLGGSALTAGVWTHLAVTVAGTGAGQYLAYKNGVLDITHAGNGGGFSGQKLTLGNNNFSDWYNGRLAAIKIYNAVLTAAEINQEMLQYLPNRTANINAFYPLLTTVDDTVDFSGSGNSLTVNGTLATEDGPPIPWRRGWVKQWAPFGGAATYNESISLGLIHEATQLGILNSPLTLALTQQEGITPTGVAASALALALAQQEGISPSGLLAAPIAISVGQGAGISDGASSTLQDLISLGLQSGVSNQGLSTIAQTIAAGALYSINLSAGGGSVYNDTIGLGVAAAIDVAVALSSQLVALVGSQEGLGATMGLASNLALSLGIIEGTGVSGRLTTNQLLALAEQFGISDSVINSYAADIGVAVGIAIANNASLQFSGSISQSVFIGIITSSLESAIIYRIFQVLFYRRNFDVDVKARIFQVPVMPRVFLVKEEGAVLQGVKDPLGNENFTFNWEPQTGAGPISASLWTGPAGLSLTNSTFTAKTSTIRVNGGVLGQSYEVINSVTLADGQLLVRRINIIIGKA